jgi:hypothetical protein
VISFLPVLHTATITKSSELPPLAQESCEVPGNPPILFTNHTASSCIRYRVDGVVVLDIDGSLPYPSRLSTHSASMREQ